MPGKQNCFPDNIRETGTEFAGCRQTVKEARNWHFVAANSKLGVRFPVWRLSSGIGDNMGRVATEMSNDRQHSQNLHTFSSLKRSRQRENENVAGVARTKLGGEPVQACAHERIAGAYGDILFAANRVRDRIAGHRRPEIDIP